MVDIINYHPKIDRFTVCLGQRLYTYDELKNLSDAMVHSLDGRRLGLAMDQTREHSMTNLPVAGEYIYIDDMDEYSGGLALVSKVTITSGKSGSPSISAEFARFPGLSVSLNYYIPLQKKLREEYGPVWAKRDDQR